MIVTLASVDLSNPGRRIDQKDIDKFAEIVHKERVDILTVQGMSRYPGVSTRLDVYEALTASTGMRPAFGEMINQSGRQTGNAIFSIYPIISSENTHYTGLRSLGFEAALQAIVDCGTREVVFISTQLPDSGSYEDLQACTTTLSSFTTYYLNDPLIVTGNLPNSGQLRSENHFMAAKPYHDRDQIVPGIWFIGEGGLKLMAQRGGKSPLGFLTIAEFGIFRPSKP
jgi:endonuclease/exonuclease/phosphatase family metal-dependent hydrolase